MAMAINVPRSIASERFFKIARNHPSRSASCSIAARLMDDEEQHELQFQIMRCRMMERDVNDPLAPGLLHDIVAELEAALQASNE